MTTDEKLKPTCQSCSKAIKQGEVVAFGNSLFHVECFKCAKCKSNVNNKSNLLVLNDGNPVCDQCSYQCSACQQNILNEAILTDDHAYHAECFKCSSCQKLIKDLIFLQTENGLYCADCQNRDEKAEQSSLSNINLFSDLTLSFFENDSNDLAHLSDSLGANLHLDMSNTCSKTKNGLRESTLLNQHRLNRASELLEKSLRTTSLILSDNQKENMKTMLATSDADKLKQDLKDSKSKIKELESSYKVLQEASQQALIEFNKIKEDYAKESKLKQKLECLVIALLRKNGSIPLKNELNELASLKIELEHTCKELADNRDKISSSIQQNIDTSLISSEYQNSLKTQISSLLQERNLLKSETKELQSTRDEMINDIVVLNTKNPEIVSVTNDLSRRAIHRAKKPDTIPQNSPPLSPSQSTESTFHPRRTREPSDADSIYSHTSQQSSFTRTIKKKGSTMFGKLSGSSKKPEPSLSSSSLLRTTTQQSGMYSTNNFSSTSIAQLDKRFMDSSVSFMGDDCCTHSFQIHSFIRPVKCGLCLEKMWGRSEYRCDHCGLLAHSKCLNKMTQENLNDSGLELPTFMHPSFSSSSSSFYNGKSKKSFSDNALFGNSLLDRCKFENRSIPLIVEECVKEVELRGLDYEGIYRKSGGAAQVRTIQLAYEQGKYINLSDENEFNDICAITSVLKQYFRELSDPLLTFEAYDKFIEISVLGNDEEKLASFTDILSHLPKAHYDTMSFIFHHLHKVVASADQNRMTVKNLAMVFAPTLMRHSDPSKDFLDISYKNATIEYLLLNTGSLFPITN